MTDKLPISGHFHADEALAVYLLRLLPTYDSSPLVRTRDPAELEKCHTVVDVGGVYDPAIHRYDHHQRTFSTTFPQRNTKLSSAGLVYMHFGKAIIAQKLSLPVDHADVDLLYEKLYTDFIEAIDANDNGISAYDPAAISTANLEKRFKEGGVTLMSMVGDMNNPDPTSPPGEPQDEDSLFGRASTLIGNAFARKLHHACTSWMPARTTVGAAYASRKEAHPSGRILVLPQGGVPWKEHLYNFEAEASGSKEIDRPTRSTTSCTQRTPTRTPSGACSACLFPRVASSRASLCPSHGEVCVTRTWMVLWLPRLRRTARANCPRVPSSFMPLVSLGVTRLRRVLWVWLFVVWSKPLMRLPHGNGISKVVMIVLLCCETGFGMMISIEREQI